MSPPTPGEEPCRAANVGRIPAYFFACFFIAFAVFSAFFGLPLFGRSKVFKTLVGITHTLNVPTICASAPSTCLSFAKTLSGPYFQLLPQAARRS